jgi:serine/threonine protein kinase
LEEALTEQVKEKVLDAAITAMEADLPDHAEDCILRAATFTREEVDEITEPLAHPLRSIVRKLIQRNPEDRYQSAAEVEAHLRAGLLCAGSPLRAQGGAKRAYEGFPEIGRRSAP